MKGAQLVPQMLLARQKLMPCVMSTEAGSRLGKGVRWPGETSAASRDLQNPPGPARTSLWCRAAGHAACGRHIRGREPPRAPGCAPDLQPLPCLRPRARNSHAVVAHSMHGLAAVQDDVQRRHGLPQLVHEPAAWVGGRQRGLEGHPDCLQPPKPR